MTELNNLKEIKEFKELITKTKATFTPKEFYPLEKNRYVFTSSDGTYVVYLDRYNKHFDFIFIPVIKPNARPRRGL